MEISTCSFFALRGIDPNVIREGSEITKKFYIATMIKEMEREFEREKRMARLNPFVSIEE